MNAPVKFQIPVRTCAPGEPMVWLTSLGLALSLLMVVGLLTLIVVNGAETFWPRRIVVMDVKEADGTSNPIGGEIVKQQTKKSAGGGEEIQLFTGNKDAFGQMFRYVDSSSITATAQPADAMVIERMEYGNALGAPIELRVKGEATIPYADARFMPRLSSLVDEVARRRSEILYLEQTVIGKNARRVSDLQTHLKARLKAGDHSEETTINVELAKLHEDYLALASKAKTLRGEQIQHNLILKLFTGKTKVISVGQIVSYHFPNQMSWLSRFFLAIGNFWSFMVDSPREANTEGGIFPAIFGTFVMTMLMSICVTPFGVIAAIYLREYARQGFFVRMVRIAVNNLAGVPSIVFGVFGLGFFVYIMGGSIDRLLFSEKLPTPTFGTGGILWSALTLALMTVPVVIVATEEAIASVPRGAKESSLACGASKWQTIQRIVLPASVPGILTGLILAMARGAGEVAPLMLVGVVKLVPNLPLDGVYPFLHLDQKFMHLGFHIFDLGFQSPDSEAAQPMVFATTFFLILLVLVLNLGAILLRNHIRRRLATAAF